jgi:hypothetical protein
MIATIRISGPDGCTFEQVDLECEQYDIDQLGDVEHHDIGKLWCERWNKDRSSTWGDEHVDDIWKDTARATDHDRARGGCWLSYLVEWSIWWVRCFSLHVRLQSLDGTLRGLRSSSNMCIWSNCYRWPTREDPWTLRSKQNLGKLREGCVEQFAIEDSTKETWRGFKE